MGPDDGSLGDTGDLKVLPAHEVIGMDEDPARAVRTKRDSTIVRAANAVHEGEASAVVSAGNTGAAMASALLRMGRLKGVARPAIATPLPIASGGSPTILIDAGANTDCRPEWLVQFALMASAFVQSRYGVESPTVALLSNGEEATKGSPLVKETRPLLEATLGSRFVGNVEGRDLLAGGVDVVVTDGFTGNVALKSLEGALRAFVNILGAVLGESAENKAAGDVIMPSLIELRPLRRSRRDRRCAAARRRRGLRDQPRQLVGAGDLQRHPAGLGPRDGRPGRQGGGLRRAGSRGRCLPTRKSAPHESGTSERVFVLRDIYEIVDVYTAAPVIEATDRHRRRGARRAQAELGTSTMKETVNEALRRAGWGVPTRSPRRSTSSAVSRPGRPTMALTHLLDTSVLRSPWHPRGAGVLEPLAAEGRLGRAAITDLEMRFADSQSARHLSPRTRARRLRVDRDKTRALPPCAPGAEARCPTRRSRADDPEASRGCGRRALGLDAPSLRSALR